MAIIEATANLKIESQKKTPTLKEERGAKSVIIIILLLARGAWRMALRHHCAHASRNTQHSQGGTQGAQHSNTKTTRPSPTPSPRKMK